MMTKVYVSETTGNVGIEAVKALQNVRLQKYILDRCCA